MRFKTRDGFMLDRKRAAALLLNGWVLQIIKGRRRPTPASAAAINTVLNLVLLEVSDINSTLPPDMKLLAAEQEYLQKCAVSIAWARLMGHIEQGESIERVAVGYIAAYNSAQILRNSPPSLGCLLAAAVRDHTSASQ